MEVTLRLDDDVVDAVDRLRHRDGLTLSEAVNRLLRDGLASSPWTARYVHQARPLGLRLDSHNVAEALDRLDDE